MARRRNQRTIFIIAAIAVLVVLAVVVFGKKDLDFHDKYAGADLSVEVEGAERAGTYTKYLSAHNGAGEPAQNATVDIFDISNHSGDVTVESNYYGEAQAVYTDIGSEVTWNVNIPEAGFYNLYMEYVVDESRGVAAERSVKINGELPFDDAANIEFTRVWTDGGEVRVDNQGNQIRPTQVEVFEWQQDYFEDDMGYVDDPYLFYFEKGNNTITLGAENTEKDVDLALAALRESVEKVRREKPPGASLL